MSRDVFKSQLLITSKAIESKTTMPILTGVKLLLVEDKLTLTGSNVDISLITTIDIKDEKADMKVYDKGGIVLDANFLLKIISSLPEKTFTLEVLENSQVHITSGKADYVVNGLDIENYPRLPEVTSQKPLTLPLALVKQVINETVFAVSKHESKPILTGVHLMLQDATLKAVATDSHRLSQRIITLENDGENFDVVLPGKSLQHISSIFGEENEEITLHITSSQILFKTENISYYSRLLEGNYPDTDRLIPSQCSTSVTFETSEISSAINRASLMSHEGQSNIVRLEIKSGKITLFGNSPEVGRFDEELSPEKVEGEDLTISFNPDYMKDALRAFGKSHIEIQFIAPIRPFTLRPTEENGEFVQLITPVRTS
nr:DNA polymerase III subunit beta [Pilibacter termitis]